MRSSGAGCRDPDPPPSAGLGHGLARAAGAHRVAGEAMGARRPARRERPPPHPRRTRAERRHRAGLGRTVGWSPRGGGPARAGRPAHPDDRLRKHHQQRHARVGGRAGTPVPAPGAPRRALCRRRGRGPDRAPRGDRIPGRQCRDRVGGLVVRVAGRPHHRGAGRGGRGCPACSTGSAAVRRRSSARSRSAGCWGRSAGRRPGGPSAASTTPWRACSAIRRRALAFAGWTAVIFVAYTGQLMLVAAALGRDLDPAVAWGALGLGIVAGVLSLLPFGLGTHRPRRRRPAWRGGHPARGGGGDRRSATA